MRHARSLFRDGVCALLLYALLLEWLYPLLDLADWSGIYRVSPFAFAFGCFVLLEWLRLPAWGNGILKVLFSLVLISYLFDRAMFLQLGWIVHYMSLLGEDVASIVRGQLDDVSSQSQTLLFLLGWSMIITVVYETVVERQRALWFVVVTLAYLLGLQLWPGLQTGQAVLRTVWFGFLLMGLLHYSRLQLLRTETSARTVTGWPLGWLAAVVLLLAGVLGIGLSLPQAKATSVMEPVDTKQWAAAWNAYWSGSLPANSSASAVSRTGYGGSDASLGGPIKQDHSEAFVARTEQVTYWRGETKLVFTGTGWEAGHASPAAAVVTSEGAQTIRQQVLLRDSGLSRVLFAGGRVVRFDALVSRSGTPMSPQLVQIDPVGGGMELRRANRSDPLLYYSMRTVVEEAPIQEEAAYLAEALQLPAQRSRRVTDLAQQITAGQTDDYARAQAIETYLRTSYTYRMDVPKPPAQAVNFVDYFLFDAKEGYCDYFSTAMAMLLREAGIPSRWVKGFAPGTVQQTGYDVFPDPTPEPGMVQVTVRNSDAHSWVEAYIDERGWVAFEPTPGFSGASLRQELADTRSAASSAAAAQPAVAAAAADKTADAPSGTSWQQRLLALREWMPQPLQLVYGVSVVLVSLGIAWAMVWGFRRWQSFQQWRALSPAAKRQLAAHRMLDRFWDNVYNRFGRKKETAMTLREYVATLHPLQGQHQAALAALVELYEAVVYGGQPLPRTAKKQLQQLWQLLRETK